MYTPISTKLIDFTVAIGVVKMGVDKRFDSWKVDFVGLGIRDGDGNPVDQTVSSKSLLESD
jgi:hypothetical protein